MFTEIPNQRPLTPLLDAVETSAQLRLLSADQLPELANQLRAYLMYSVGQTGGHFGAGLGVVELTIALHYVFNTPEDRLVWDVGHQAYPHKILTGRREQMSALRQKNGIHPFPDRSESPFDAFGVGHSSTSISAALGMAIAAKLQNIKRKSVAIIGDGAMTAGMAFEALNHASDVDADLLVVLNDNDMSISHNVGGLSNYLAKILSSRAYNRVRETGKKALSTIPSAMDFVRKTEEHMKGMVVPSTFFEELGFNYIGPFDGHNLPNLIKTLTNIKELKGPQFLHVVTQKGKGFQAAEDNPIKYHALGKIEPKKPLAAILNRPKKMLSYSNIFGQWLCEMAQSDSRLVGITPAMPEGSDMTAFSKSYPERYFDVAIAEQHAVTLAAGLSCEGLKPIVAIYSTFLQRAYDQLIHDVAIQNLDVLFAIDRAGLVGEDGPTHCGNYDLSYLRCIPNILIMTPSSGNELWHMLYTGYLFPGVAAVRYPRGVAENFEPESMKLLPIGKGNIVRHGYSVVMLVFGPLLSMAKEVADEIDATVVDMRFVKPLDESLISRVVQTHDLVVTLEENTIKGGAGSAVNEYLHGENVQKSVLNLGIPDEFIAAAKPTEQKDYCGLSKDAVLLAIKKRLHKKSFEKAVTINFSA